MVNKRTPQQSKRSPVIAEPALANRPKRNISPKSWDNSSVLSWREEQELKKALYASLHDVKRQNSDPCDQGSADNNTEPSCSYSADSTPKTKRTRSVSVEKVVQKQAGLETRRHSYGSSVKQNEAKKLKSEDRELRRRTRLSSTSTDTNKPAEYEVSTSSVTDETSQDSVNSTGSQETKRKFSAQRKFAQIHGCGYGYVYTPTTTPVKQSSSGSSCRTPPVKVFPKRAKTEDFLTFLCLRGTSALPPHMDMYNFTREDSNGADSSYPATPSNGRRHGRESSPSSSSTSVSQEEGFCPISPLKSLITPTKKAARASAGTPDVARGLATRHTKNSMRSAKQEITPVKSSPIKRTAKLTGSPTKMVKSDRIKMKKKAVATLTSMDKRSRKKSLFANEQSDGSSVKKSSEQQLFAKSLRTHLKRAVQDAKKRRKKTEDYIASRLPPRKARHSDFGLYVETEDLDDSLESKLPSPVFEVEKRKRKIESRIDVDDEISLKVPIKQSRLFKTEMKVRKPKVKENFKKSRKFLKNTKQNKVSSESKGVSTRSSSRQQSESTASTQQPAASPMEVNTKLRQPAASNLFLSQKLKKLKRLKQEKRDTIRKNESKISSRRTQEREFKKKVVDDTPVTETEIKADAVEQSKKIEDLAVRKKGKVEQCDKIEDPVVRKKGRQAGKKPSDKKQENWYMTVLKMDRFPDPSSPAALVDVPVYRPTEQEFANTMNYIQTIAMTSRDFGICKIVPPESFKLEGKINEDVRFVSQRQITNKLYQRQGPSAVEMESILYHLENNGIIEQVPVIGGIEVDLCQLSQVIKNMGGMQRVTEKKKWQKVADIIGIPKNIPERGNKLYEVYCRFLVTFDAMPDLEKQKLMEKVTDILKKKGAEDSCFYKGKNMTLTAFSKMAKNVEQAFGCEENTPIEKIERQYWDTVEHQDRHVVVHSGHLDTHKYHCSGFSAKKDARNPWNLNKLYQKPGSVLHYLGPVQGVTVPILHAGVTVPILHAGMLYSTSCWSLSPQLLPYVSYSHSGSDVLWYCVPTQEVEKFNSVIKSIVPEDGSHKSSQVMIPPSELIKRGVSVSRCVQRPGEFVIVFPKCISANVCAGFVVTESVCYALPDWLSVGQIPNQPSLEKEAFSLEELLCKIIEDPHSSKDLLSHALPVVQDMVEKEISLRSQLQEAGLKMSRRMYTNIGQIKTSPGGTSRCMDDVEEILTFCEASKKVCYLSMVLNEADDLAFRPEYGLQHIQKKRNMKSCVFMYRHSVEELKGMIFNATERLKSKDCPDSPSKRKRKST